jgi:hypothetical protein
VKVRTTRRPLRILDFDTECRPMHYSEWRPESQITAYAWSWVGDDRVHGGVLAQDGSNDVDLLMEFIDAFDEADMVTGHYVRKHDLPLINDHCIQLGLLPISERPGGILVQDTKQDFVQVKALGLSQDNLGVLFQTGQQKHHMAGRDWWAANQLSPEGAKLAWQRVSSDVLQHKQLRAALVDAGALRPPRRWPR